MVWTLQCLGSNFLRKSILAGCDMITYEKNFGFDLTVKQFTRKYPLCGYILGGLAHTTASDQYLESDETLNPIYHVRC